jgi:hypothetical protein
VPGINLPLAKSRVVAAGTPRQVKALNFGEESYGDLEEISEIIFSEMEEGSIGLLQIYEKQNLGDRSYYANHIPRDIVDEWRGGINSMFGDAEGVKESLQAVVAKNTAMAHTSHTYLVGRFATNRLIREIFGMEEGLESVSIYGKTTVCFNVDTEAWRGS